MIWQETVDINSHIAKQINYITPIILVTLFEATLNKINVERSIIIKSVLFKIELINEEV